MIDFRVELSLGKSGKPADALGLMGSRVCHLKHAFQNSDYFKPVIFKKQKIQKEPLTLPSCLPTGIQMEKSV